MNILTGGHIARRTFIRGMGATVALPFLDAMVPAGRLGAQVLAQNDRTGLVCIETPHGCAGSAPVGKELNLWSPAGLGTDFDLSPTSVAPLEPFKEYLTIVSNTDTKMAEAFADDEIGGDHFRSSAVFLTQCHARHTEGADVYVGKSLDQMFAERVGHQTPIPSMQLCIENIDTAGGCQYGYTCVYTDNISWKSPEEPLPMIRDPRIAFEQLFGAGATPEERQVRLQTQGSLLDWITKEIGSLKKNLGTNDSRRMEQYLNSVREVERRIQKIVERNTSGEEREIPEAPAGVPDSFREHVELMFDLQALAFETDMTRVFSFKLSRDISARTYPESGTGSAFHSASHHGETEDGLRDFALINKYQVSMLPYFLERLSSTMEGDKSLLDKTAILYGSPMANSNQHAHRAIPLLFVGGANGGLHRGGIHIKAPDGTPTANAMLSFLDGIGVKGLKSFGDSTGRLSLGTA